MEVKIIHTDKNTVFVFPNDPGTNIKNWLRGKSFKGQYCGRENSWTGPAVKDITQDFAKTFGKNKKEPKKPAKVSKPQGLAGFVSMNQVDKQQKVSNHPRIQLNGDIGRLMGNMERYQLAFTLEGDQGGGKTRLMYQLANAFAEKELKIAILSLEIGSESGLVREMRDMYIASKNRNNVEITGQEGFWALVKSMNEVDKKTAVHKAMSVIANHYDAILIDSFGKLEIPTTSIDELRNTLPKTIFGFIFQRTVAGTIRGGTTPLFDCGINIEVVKDKESYKNNYAFCSKNRYNDEEALKYSIYHKTIIKEEKEE